MAAIRRAEREQYEELFDFYFSKFAEGDSESAEQRVEQVTNSLVKDRLSRATDDEILDLFGRIIKIRSRFHFAAGATGEGPIYESETDRRARVREEGALAGKLILKRTLSRRKERALDIPEAKDHLRSC